MNGDKELDEALEDIGCAAVKGAVTGGASAVIAAPVAVSSFVGSLFD